MFVANERYFNPMCKKHKKVHLSFPLKYVGPTLLFTHLKDLKLFKHLLYEKLRAAENPQSLIIRKLPKHQEAFLFLVLIFILNTKPILKSVRILKT